MFWQTTLRILCELHKKKSTETRLVAKLGLSRHCCNKGESIEHGSGDESEPTNCIQSSLALSMALSIKQLQTRMPNQPIGVMITNRIRSIGRSVIRRFSNDLEIGIFSSKFSVLNLEPTRISARDDPRWIGTIDGMRAIVGQLPFRRQKRDHSFLEDSDCEHSKPHGSQRSIEARKRIYCVHNVAAATVTEKVQLHPKQITELVETILPIFTFQKPTRTGQMKTTAFWVCFGWKLRHRRLQSTNS